MNLFRNTSEYLKCRGFVIQSVNVRKNNTFAVNLLSTVDRKHGIIDIDLIRKPNNHYRKMLGNGTEPKYTDVYFGDKGETVQSLPETVQKMVKEELF